MWSRAKKNTLNSMPRPILVEYYLRCVPPKIKGDRPNSSLVMILPLKIDYLEGWHLSSPNLVRGVAPRAVMRGERLKIKKNQTPPSINGTHVSGSPPRSINQLRERSANAGSRRRKYETSRVPLRATGAHLSCRARNAIYENVCFTAATTTTTTKIPLPPPKTTKNTPPPSLRTTPAIHNRSPSRPLYPPLRY